MDTAHHIEGRREGDWILYECSLCDYKRKFNQVTRQMKSNRAAKESEIRHFGAYSDFPAEMMQVKMSAEIKQPDAKPAIKIPFNLN